MTPNQIIEKASLAKIHLATDGKELHLTADQKPSPELVELFKSNKAGLIRELKHRQQVWLWSVANGLGMNARDVLKHKVLVIEDVRKHWHLDPKAAVDVISEDYTFKALMQTYTLIKAG